MKKRVQSVHAITTLILVALLYSFFYSPIEPAISPSPAPPAAQTEQPETTPRSGNEIEGKYAYSDGYSGESLALHDGKYERGYFSCTGQGVASTGTYKFEEPELILTDPKRGVESRFTLKQGHLIARLDDGYTLDFVKHIDAQGNEVEGAQVIQNRLLRAPESTPDRVAKGRELYRTNCQECHGSDGLAPSPKHQGAASMELSRKVDYKYGTDPESLYRSVAFGVEGSSMAPWESILTDNEIWNLCLYLSSIQR